MTTTFFRVLDPEPAEKGKHLRRAIRVFTREGHPDGESVFLARADQFEDLPEAPFAYWAAELVRRIFGDSAQLEGNFGTAKQGLATADNFRFLRTWWEVDPREIGHSAADTNVGKPWIHFASSGEYSPYFSEIRLVVNWASEGKEIRNFYTREGRLRSRPQNIDYYFEPGVTFPRRSQRFAGSPLPKGCIFSNGVQAAFPDESERLPDMVGLFCSDVFFFLLALYLGKIETEPQYEVGQVGRVPIPDRDFPESVRKLVREAVQHARNRQDDDEVSHGHTGAWQMGSTSGDPTPKREREVVSMVNEYVYSHYGLSDPDSRKMMERELRKSALAHLAVNKDRSQPR